MSLSNLFLTFEAWAQEAERSAEALLEVGRILQAAEWTARAEAYRTCAEVARQEAARAAKRGARRG